MLTWNAHAIRAQVTKTQYAATVCDHNDLDVVAGPVLHDLIESALLPECGEVHAQRLPASQNIQA